MVNCKLTLRCKKQRTLLFSMLLALVMSFCSSALSAKQTIPVGTKIYEILSDPLRPYIYASDSKVNQVLVINKIDRTIVNRLQVGIKPTDMDFDIHNSILFVANTGGNSISVVDLETQTVSDTISLSFAPSTLVAGRQDRVYAGGCTEDDLVRNEIVSIDVQSHSEVSRFAGAAIHATTADGLQAFVTESCGSSSPELKKWDISTDTPSTLLVENAWGGGCNWGSVPQLVLGPDEQKIYLASGNSSCSGNFNGVLPVFNANTFLKVGELDLDFVPISVNVDSINSTVYASHNGLLINPDSSARHDSNRDDIHTYNAATFVELPHLPVSDSVGAYAIASDADNSQLFAVVGTAPQQNIDVICLSDSCNDFINTVYPVTFEETSIDLQVYVDSVDDYNLYGVCVSSGDVPSAADIKAGRKNDVNLAEASFSFSGVSGNAHSVTCDGLIPNTEYSVFVVTEPQVDIFSDVVIAQNITTLEKRDTSINLTIPLNTTIVETILDNSRSAIYIADSGVSSIHILDIATRQIVEQIHLPEKPIDIDVSKDNLVLYVGTNNSVISIDLETRAIVGSMPLDFTLTSFTAGRSDRGYASRCVAGFPNTNEVVGLDLDNNVELGRFAGSQVHATDSTGSNLFITSGCGFSNPSFQKWDVTTDSPSHLLSSNVWGGGCSSESQFQVEITEDDSQLYLVSGRSTCSANYDGTIPVIDPSTLLKKGEVALDWNPVSVGFNVDKSVILAAHSDGAINANDAIRHDRTRKDVHVFSESFVEGRHLETSEYASEQRILISNDGAQVFTVVGEPGSQNIDVRCLSVMCAPIVSAVYFSGTSPTSSSFDVVVNSAASPNYDVYAVCVDQNDMPSAEDIKAGRRNNTDPAESATVLLNVAGNSQNLSCESLNSLTDYRVFVFVEGDGFSEVFSSSVFTTQILRDSTSSKTIPLSSTVNSLISDPQRPYVYGTDSETNEVFFINTASREIEKRIFAGSKPSKMALSQDGDKLYVAISGGSSIAVIDLELQVALTPLALTFSPSSIVAGRMDRLYIGGCTEDSNVRNEIVILDAITGQEISRFVGSIPHAADVEGNNLYVTHGCGFTFPEVVKWDISTDSPIKLLSEPLWGGGCNWQTAPSAVLSDDDSLLHMLSGDSRCSINDDGILPFYSTSTFAKVGDYELDYIGNAGVFSQKNQLSIVSHNTIIINATPGVRHDASRKDIHVFDGISSSETPHIETSASVSEHGLVITPSAKQVFAVVGPQEGQSIDVRCLVEKCSNSINFITQSAESETAIDFSVSVITGDDAFNLYAVCTQSSETPSAADIKAGRINATTPAEGAVSLLGVRDAQNSLSCSSVMRVSNFTVHAVVESQDSELSSIFSQSGFFTNDGDTVSDDQDNCPMTANQSQSDIDSDGLGDACDSDDDNDGVQDLLDLQPFNPLVCRDLDGDRCDDCSVSVDGFGVLSDFDVGNDGSDNDLDGLCDIGDVDDDNDLSEDEDDNCPLIANNDQSNLDGDEFGDACDDDADGDTVLSINDSNDFNALICSDTDLDQCDDCNSSIFDVANDGRDNDSDGACDIGDLDDDNDQIPDSTDNCPFIANLDQADQDQDLIGDACDNDADGDNIGKDQDSNDLNPLVCSDSDNDSCDDCSSGVFNLTNDGNDTDRDGFCNIGDTNDDNDLFLDVVDNCSLIANDDQSNLDKDEFGDACDGDIDGDNVLTLDDSDDFDPFACSDNDLDQCDDCSSGKFNIQDDGSDNDSDGFCDLGDANDDSDTILDELDNCVFTANEDQLDNDGDGMGDVCDDDADGDSVSSGLDSDDLNKFICSDNDADTCDDCSSGTFSLVNDGLDSDSDGVCNVSDLDDDNDTVVDELDNCPLIENTNQAIKPCEDEICVPLKAKDKLVVICL